jgi:hypothetical protein
VQIEGNGLHNEHAAELSASEYSYFGFTAHVDKVKGKLKGRDRRPYGKRFLGESGEAEKEARK